MSSLRSGRRTSAILAILLLLAVASSRTTTRAETIAVSIGWLSHREKLAGRLAEREADGHQILGRWAVALAAATRAAGPLPS